MAVAQTRDGRWYVAGRPGFWPDDPGRRREYFGRGSNAEAKARARGAELLSEKDRGRGISGPTFAACAWEYFQKKNFRENPRNQLKIRLQKIILPQLGNRVAVRLKAADMDRYVAVRRAHKTRRGTPLKDSTIRREIVDIKAILSWASNPKYCSPPMVPFNPVANYTPPVADDEVILPPTQAEAIRIYQHASAHLKRVIILAYYLGLRPGAVELLTLSWGDSVQAPLLPEPWDSPEARKAKYAHIDALIEANQLPAASLGVIRVRSAHKGGPTLRDVPIHAGLLTHLYRWHKEDGGSGPMIHYHGHAITKIQHSWEGALSRAGITRRIRPYDLRHAYITKILESGGDIGALSDVVGSRPETLRRHYQHVSRELVRRTVDLIPELKIGPDTPGTTKARSTRPLPANPPRSRIYKR